MLALILLYTILEGYSKYVFYLHNRSAGFPYKRLDENKKHADAAMFTIFLLCVAPWQLWFAGFVVRLMAIDTILNLLRPDLHWAHVGTRDPIGKLVRCISSRLDWRLINTAIVFRVSLIFVAIVTVILHRHGII